MVGGDVGHNRHLRAAAHTDELEAGKLHHRHIAGGDVGQLGKQRGADVAAQEYLASGRLKHLGNEGGGSSLAVGTGHGDNLAGAELKEQLHLTGDHRAGLFGGLQSGLEVLIAGGAHDDVLPGKSVGVVFAQAELNVPSAQGFGIVAKILDGFFLVAESDLGAKIRKHGDAGLVADARANEGDLFAGHQGFQFFHGRHKQIPPSMNHPIYPKSDPAQMQQFACGSKPQANQSSFC